MNENENKRTSESQCAQIKEWLMRGNKLTALDALNLFGCMRLASRIHDLREKGLNVKKERIVTTSGKYITEYSLNNN